MIPNVFTRIIIDFLTDKGGGYCIADELRKQVREAGLVLDAQRLRSAATMLLITNNEARALSSPWRQLLLAVVRNDHGVDWNYVSTSLATDHAMN